MTNNRANHPGKEHNRPTGIRSKKQFVRRRGERDILWIHNAEDWARIYRSGDRVPLVCPDANCGKPMKAVERRKPRLTRYLADIGEHHCDHFVPVGGGGPTDEHLWLQGKVRDACRLLGYSAELESQYADVRVESDPPYAVEVQRVSSDFEKRTQQRKLEGMETLWLLPESEKQKDTGRRSRIDPLFTHPAVRIRYRDPRRPSQSLTWCEAREVGIFGENGEGVSVDVTVTLWEAKPGATSFNRSRALSLEDFLRQVLSGERRWYQKHELHERHASGRAWAGWVLGADVQNVRNARKERDERRHALQQAAELRRKQEKDRHVNGDAETVANTTVVPKRTTFAMVEQGGNKTSRDEHKSRGKPETVHTRQPDLETEEHRENQIELVSYSVPWWKRVWRCLKRLSPGRSRMDT